MTEQTENSTKTSQKSARSTPVLSKKLEELEERIGSKLKDMLLDLDGKLNSNRNYLENLIQERFSGIQTKLETVESLFLQIGLEEAGSDLLSFIKLSRGAG